MDIRFLLSSSVALFTLFSHASAADNVTTPDPEPAAFVSVCDAYGAGYFYIPGTETCLRLHGYVRSTIQGGEDVYGRGFENRDGVATLRHAPWDSWDNSTRFTLRASTASETDMGTLKTFAETRAQWDNETDSSSTGTLRAGYIDLNGLRIGLDQSAFVGFIGGLGDVVNDDVIPAGGYRTGLISYSVTRTDGVSATLSLEQGNDGDTDSRYGYSGVMGDYTPHIVGGLKYQQGWGLVAAVAAYDSRQKEFAVKLRGNLTVSDRLSLWMLAGYKSATDTYMDVMDANGRMAGQVRALDSLYGQWGSNWAVWSGGTYKFTDKAIFNAQLSYDGSGTFAATADVAYELVPGYTVTPEVSYVHWHDKKSILDGLDALQALIMVQRTF